MSDQDPPFRTRSLTTSLDLSNIGTSENSSPVWKALAYLNGANAFCDLVESCCAGPKQRRRLEEAAELYIELALHEVALVEKAHRERMAAIESARSLKPAAKAK